MAPRIISSLYPVGLKAPSPFSPTAGNGANYLVIVHPRPRQHSHLTSATSRARPLSSGFTNHSLLSTRPQNLGPGPGLLPARPLPHLNL